MKAIRLILNMGLIWGLIGCGFMGGFNETSLTGTYEGTFQRTVEGNSQGIANVQLTFEGGLFNGNSDEQNYPVICSGSYSLNRSTIQFSNTCMFTADFDWTLILNGDFRIEREGNELILTKSDGVTVDRYSLVKKEKVN